MRRNEICALKRFRTQRSFCGRFYYRKKRTKIPLRKDRRLFPLHVQKNALRAEVGEGEKGIIFTTVPLKPIRARFPSEEKKDERILSGEKEENKRTIK